MGCSVDFRTSDVAVTNYETLEGGQGNFVIFRRGRGAPRPYRYPYTDYYYCSYDENGDLFADGEYEGQGGFELTELPAGSTKVIGITPNQSFDYPPGNVQWHNHLLTIGDTRKNVIYRFEIDGVNAIENGSTVLGSGDDVLQYWIEGSMIVGPNAGSATVMLWDFPGGGPPLKTLTNVTSPAGAVVSRYVAPTK